MIWFICYAECLSRSQIHVSVQSVYSKKRRTLKSIGLVPRYYNIQEFSVSILEWKLEPKKDTEVMLTPLLFIIRYIFDYFSWLVLYSRIFSKFIIKKIDL
jgi:hypothetical protein